MQSKDSQNANPEKDSQNTGQTIDNRIEFELGKFITKSETNTVIGKTEKIFKRIHTYRVIFKEFDQPETWFPMIGPGRQWKGYSKDKFYEQQNDFEPSGYLKRTRNDYVLDGTMVIGARIELPLD
jgi:hypothetical protein